MTAAERYSLVRDFLLAALEQSFSGLSYDEVANVVGGRWKLTGEQVCLPVGGSSAKLQAALVGVVGDLGMFVKSAHPKATTTDLCRAIRDLVPELRRESVAQMNGIPVTSPLATRPLEEAIAVAVLSVPFLATKVLAAGVLPLFRNGGLRLVVEDVAKAVQDGREPVRGLILIDRLPHHDDRLRIRDDIAISADAKQTEAHLGRVLDRFQREHRRLTALALAAVQVPADPEHLH